ncbi:hypothetical protein PV724_44475 [Streptomyces europaeiscabiei]|uniref:hypothetical protein n=1 Tax=Streptomyces europaeiscabiei TaxID=146819 RepID=UPI0029AD8C17|nr:hypothetical protein [Streptomyces europaeiscabiei]MDX3549534.1 hypothetical protein [Streptomyces europaeiscabiei]
MSQPTDPERAAESGTEAIPRPADRPSPVRAARGAYAAHTAGCPKCSDVDRDRCNSGQELWRAWEGACEEAYRQLSEYT